MKVLIIALPRTGSTSLLSIISQQRNLKSIFEPFHPTPIGNWDSYDKNEDNIVVKTIVCHHNNNIELCKNFDEVILLGRKNFKEHLESHSYHVYFSKTKGYHHTNPYVYKSPPIDLIELCKKDLIRMNKELEDISNQLNIPIFYYEDLFDIYSDKRLRLKEEKNKII
jgi:hypothetical protein